MKKRLLAGLLCGVMLAAVGCGSSNKDVQEQEETEAVEEQEEQTYTPAAHESGKYYVGIIQQADHEALSEVAEGFQEELSALLGVQVVFDYQVADGTKEGCQEIVDKFVMDQDDMIIAEGTMALSIAADATTEIPILGAAVTDFIAAGAVSSTGEPGRNVTGISDLPPMSTQEDYLVEMLGTEEKVGIVYSSLEANAIFEVSLIEEYLKDDNVDYEVYTFTNTEEIQSTIERAMDETDVIYLPTDNTLAVNMDVIKQASLDKEVPVFTSDENMCKLGGVLTYGIDYRVLGERTADMAYDILLYDADDEDSDSGSTSDETAEEDDDTGNIEKTAIDRVRDTAVLKYNPEMAELLGYTPPYSAVAIEMEETSNVAETEEGEANPQ